RTEVTILFEYNKDGVAARIAREIVRQSIFERREWTKADIKAEFGLSDVNLDTVKRVARRGVAPYEFGVLWGYRSEEHTSELQSRENLVCRVLLEKKKKNNKERR